MTPGIRRTRQVPQGDPCAADFFWAALDVPATGFCEKCQAEKWGLPTGGNNMGLLLFADNCWLIATSPAELEAWLVLDYELRGKRLCGARQPLTVWRQKLWWMTRRSFEGRENKVSRPWVTFDGHFVNDLAEREVIARRSFHAIRKLLCDNKVSLRHRLRFFSSCVTSSLYCCSGIWILTQSQCTHLRAIQDKMLRRMIYVPRRPLKHLKHT